MSTYVCDFEADSLTPTKIWCLGCQDVDENVVRTTVNYDNMRKLLTNPEHTLIIHNGKRWDVPNVERLLGIKIVCKVIDTLFLSWYLEPNRPKHGLDSYGEEAGIPKPPIDDWEDLPIEDYLHRVTEDVKINMYVWKKQLTMLRKLYNNDWEEISRLIDFLMLHATVAANQEKYGWKLDIERCKRVIEELKQEQVVRYKELEESMGRGLAAD